MPWRNTAAVRVDTLGKFVMLTFFDVLIENLILKSTRCFILQNSFCFCLVYIYCSRFNLKKCDQIFQKMIENAVWFGFNCKCFRNMFEKIEENVKSCVSKYLIGNVVRKWMVENTWLMIWHALGKGPANFL